MVVKSWLSLICIFLDEWMRLLDYVASSPKGSDDVQLLSIDGVVFTLL